MQHYLILLILKGFISKYIQKSDLFVLTSKFEGLPNVLLEAICLNKFVISTDCPTGPKEILDNKKGGILFNIGDSKSLAKNIIYFSKNKKKCKSKLDFAKKRLYRFDYNNNLNKYRLVINKYLN